MHSNFLESPPCTQASKTGKIDYHTKTKSDEKLLKEVKNQHKHYKHSSWPTHKTSKSTLNEKSKKYRMRPVQDSHSKWNREKSWNILSKKVRIPSQHWITPKE
jgi:hypothetical protein